MKVEYLVGRYNTGLGVNDTRITSGKIWGIFHADRVFDVDESLIEDMNEFEVYRDELFLNGKPTQGKVSLEEFGRYLEEMERRRKRFVADRKHEHHWELVRRERWKVSREDIMEALGYREYDK